MENKLIQVVKEGDSLFGKAFTFIKELGEHVLVEIETEAGKIERVFHKDHVQVIHNNVPTVTKAEDVKASGVVLETAPAPGVTATPSSAPAPGVTATPSSAPASTTASPEADNTATNGGDKAVGTKPEDQPAP